MDTRALVSRQAHRLFRIGLAPDGPRETPWPGTVVHSVVCLGSDAGFGRGQGAGPRAA
jgi:hypothetical protein